MNPQVLKQAVDQNGFAIVEDVMEPEVAELLIADIERYARVHCASGTRALHALRHLHRRIPSVK